MTSPIPITIPFANVNDESAVLLEWCVPDGELVEAGTLVATIETSKAAIDIESPARGFLRQIVRVGQDIAVGNALCYLTDKADSPLPTHSTDGATVAKSSDDVCGSRSPMLQSDEIRKTWFTPVARKIAEAHDMLDQFAGKHRVSKEDVYTVLSSRASANTEHDSALEPVPTWTAATRFSTRARALMEKHQLSSEIFAGHGLVREQDIIKYLNPVTKESVPIVDHPATASSDRNGGAYRNVPETNILAHLEALPKRKQCEIRNLATGLTNTLPNTVIVACPTRGLRRAIAASPSFQGNTSIIIIFEVARLLRQFTVFNACYVDNQIRYYDEVNIGFAVDAGKGLKVPVIRQADTKSMLHIATEMQELMVDYLNDTLSVESLSAATFTISDLSGEGVFAFTPLISGGQSAILGICGEFFAPENPGGLFNLALTFDHQVAEGKQAAMFLSELRRRLTAYENALDFAANGTEDAATTAERLAPARVQCDELSCSRCMRTVEYLQSIGAYLMPTMRVEGSTRLICTLCLRGY